MVRGRKGFHKDVFEMGTKLGLESALVDGQRTPLEPIPSLNRYEEHSIELIVGAGEGKGTKEQFDSLVRKSLSIGDGDLMVYVKGKNWAFSPKVPALNVAWSFLHSTLRFLFQ